MSLLSSSATLPSRCWLSYGFAVGSVSDSSQFIVGLLSDSSHFIVGSVSDSCQVNFRFTVIFVVGSSVGSNIGSSRHVVGVVPLFIVALLTLRSAPPHSQIVFF